jgi:ParB family chromosome partitioning protein
MTDINSHRRRLGRGLTSLLGGPAPAHEEQPPQDQGELRQLPVESIERNPFQPRKNFDSESLGELASSVREHGILQPLLVRELGDGFQLVAGERRWLAAKKAGLTTVPCRIVDIVDKTACEFALEENLKRRDLTDLEKAQAFRDYLAHFQCTIEELSRQLSMSRSTISNLLRLLDLPEPVKNALQSGNITAGHARSLLALEEADRLAFCGRIQAEGLNVRETEAAVKRRLQELSGESAQEAADEPPRAAGNTGEVDTLPITSAPDATEPHRTNHIVSIEEQLRDLLGTKVEIKLRSKESGSIVIPFSSGSEFERILGELRRRAA